MLSNAVHYKLTLLTNWNQCFDSILYKFLPFKALLLIMNLNVFVTKCKQWLEMDWPVLCLFKHDLPRLYLWRLESLRFNSHGNSRERPVSMATIGTHIELWLQLLHLRLHPCCTKYFAIIYLCALIRRCYFVQSTLQPLFPQGKTSKAFQLY